MKEKAFIEQLTRMIEYREKGEFDKALGVVEYTKSMFPERIRKPILWKASILCELGQLDQAMGELLKADETGIWWNPDSLNRPPEFASIRERSEFQRLLERGKEYLKNANDSSSPLLKTVRGSEDGPSVLTFHWRGSTAEDFSEYWLDSNKTWTFGFAQSSQVYEDNSYCWDDSERTNSDVSMLYKQFSSDVKGSLILAGASQGGKIAIEHTLADNEIPADGFITLAPAVKELETLVPLLSSAKERGIRGCIIIGQNDFLYDRVHKLRLEMERTEFPCMWIEVPELGHFFPENFSTLLEKAANYILVKDRITDKYQPRTS